MKRLFKAPAIQLSEITAQDGAQWIQILKLCTVNYMEDDKERKLVIDENLFNSLIKNFNDDVLGIKIMIDIAHDTEGPAAGWIKNLKIMEGRLMAEVEWTELGLEQKEKKLYAYISADYDPNYVDNETGKSYGPTLRGAALTNRPVIKKMQPTVQLSETTSTREEIMTEKELELTEKLQASEKKLAEMEKKFADMEKKLSESSEVSEEVVQASENNKKLAVQLAEVNKTIETLAETNKELMEKARLSEKEKDFSVLMSEGKAVPAQKEAFLKGDMIEFAKLAQSVNLSERGRASRTVEGATMTEKEAEAKLIQLSEAKVKDKGVRFSEAQKQVLLENPELKKALDL